MKKFKIINISIILPNKFFNNFLSVEIFVQIKNWNLSKNEK